MKFASIASHDLKAPLRAIGSLTEIIEEEEQNNINADSKNHFKTIKKRVNRLDALLNSLLEYSLVTETKINPTTVDTYHCIQQLTTQHFAAENISIKLSGNFPELHINKYHIEKIFTILISNAIYFNNNSEINIHITASILNNVHQFEVTDNGPGIDERFHGKIFEIFQTLQPRDDFESNGAGLAIAKKIVEHHGGNISVKSGYGWSTFCFSIPEATTDY
jgi:light-regulated signal transduction histidine kinase (bacteriophytochrome)